MGLGSSSSTKQDDDFFGLGAGTTTVERRSFHSSIFLKLYNKTPKRPTDELVIAGLKSLSDGRFHRFFTTDKVVLAFAEEKTDDKSEITAKKCGYCWTVQSPKFYGKLKGALIADDVMELKGFMPFIRALNTLLVCQRMEEMEVYRGSYIPLEDVKRFSKGFTYRIPYYVPTTTDANVAKTWRRHKSNYRLKFKLPKGCPNAGSMVHVSRFKGEKEVLLPPYTAVHVLSKDKDSMSLLVLDNLRVDSETSAYLVKVGAKGLNSLYRCAGIAGAGVVGAAVGGGIAYSMSSAALVVPGPVGVVAAAANGMVFGMIAGSLVMNVMVALGFLKGINQGSIAGVATSAAEPLNLVALKKKDANFEETHKFID